MGRLLLEFFSSALIDISGFLTSSTPSPDNIQSRKKPRKIQTLSLSFLHLCASFLICFLYNVRMIVVLIETNRAKLLCSVSLEEEVLPLTSALVSNDYFALSKNVNFKNILKF